MPSTIFKRTIIDEISRYLSTNDVIVIQGARQVGKTCILKYFQNLFSEQNIPCLYIDLEDSRFVTLLDQGVDEFLNYLRGEGYRLSDFSSDSKKLTIMIDEIQYLADPSAFMKLIADHHRYLKLIVSGSSSFAMKSKFKNSLVGRTVNFEIYPLSFREMLSFKNIHYAPDVPPTLVKIQEYQALYLDYVLYGGYPKIVLTPELDRKERYLQQIIDTYIRKDIRDLADIKDITRFNKMLEVLSSQSGNLLNIAELSNTCGLARQTIERYLLLLEETYILTLVRPYSRNLRTEVYKTPKIFFYDTGLMQMLWLKRLQREALGVAFETSVFSELTKQLGRGAIHYWRTIDKKEIDFIVRLPEIVIPIEVKLHFPRHIPPAINHFWRAAEPGTPTPYRVVGLYGEPVEPQKIYPWQLAEIQATWLK